MLKVAPLSFCIWFALAAIGRADQPILVDAARYAWTQPNIQTALSVLANAGAEGLDPDRYRVSLSGDGDRDRTVLTGAVLSYMQELSSGRTDLKVDSDIELPARPDDAQAMLYEALKANRLAPMLAGLAPSQPGYLALKKALAEEPDQERRLILMANMERWRWLPPRPEADRIEVNAAAAELTMWLGGREVLSSRVIVGKPDTRTPILRAEGAGLTINPAWTVPHSIAVKEILPKLKRNRAWLAKEDMVLLDGPPDDPHGLHINWRGIPAGTFPYRLRQAPGAKNPLGEIKLELPNRFDVYLHDTPGKAAFRRVNRAQSHGCIRVEQILPLATFALAAGPDSMAVIRDAIGQGQTRYLPLTRKLPIYVVYWTARPGVDGAIEYVPDIYARDARMIAAMHHQPVRIAAIQPSCPTDNLSYR
ncbi:MAG: L,D-transpeptidase family protein [Alphaproteobacteria bacterium]